MTTTTARKTRRRSAKTTSEPTMAVIEAEISARSAKYAAADRAFAAEMQRSGSSAMALDVYRQTLRDEQRKIDAMLLAAHAAARAERDERTATETADARIRRELRRG